MSRVDDGSPQADDQQQGANDAADDGAGVGVVTTAATLCLCLAVIQWWFCILLCSGRI